ncbi:ectonucleoside triphosphate diphosphohydrolase 2 isoform X3 [Melospiza melodia melodia]|uniref:ectonucleoside triphosphate diphosphohydrolase 2 isoform X3 n=1 Tax=Melospiza melodia melodia TaxID=1914991 RepID=UPI002FD3B63C
MLSRQPGVMVTCSGGRAPELHSTGSPYPKNWSPCAVPNSIPERPVSHSQSRARECPLWAGVGPAMPGWAGQSLPLPDDTAELLGTDRYGIVLDAGSSHTAMFIYKWPADKENDTGVVSEHSMCDVEGPGISSYSSNPLAAGTSLEHCLSQALRDVPKEKHAGTPLYLGATAGMRLLNIADPQASDAVLRAVAATLKTHPFDFRGAKILSGEEEGVFGWVTANYLLENFIKRGWLGEWIQPQKKTLGAMDFGGASTQITFETRDTIENPRNEVMLKLYGQAYKVYTHSFLCYGRDQVLKRLLSKFLQAFSAFFYTVDFIQTVMGRPVHLPSDLKDAAETICATSWSELLLKAPKLEKRLPDYCAISTFVYLLTTKGYSFNNHSFPNIAFQKKAGETSIGWALGYMLNLTNMIPAEKPSSHKSMLYNYWVILILLFVVTTLTSLVTAICLLRHSKSSII